MLATLVVFDLAIPRLVQRIIDQGIGRRDRALVIHTSLLMLGVSALSTLLAIGNNVTSVRVGEGVARDLRRALFLKMQSFSYANLDRAQTGQLLVRLTSDVNAVKGLVQISLRIGTRAPLMMLGSLVLMVSTSRDLAQFGSPKCDESLGAASMQPTPFPAALAIGSPTNRFGRFRGWARGGFAARE